MIMSIVPLDLQRQFERRWAARFSPPVAAARPEKQLLEKRDQPLATLGKGKGKTRRIDEVCSGGVSSPWKACQN
jgi:hypothetical protein